MGYYIHHLSQIILKFLSVSCQLFFRVCSSLEHFRFSSITTPWKIDSMHGHNSFSIFFFKCVAHDCYEFINDNRIRHDIYEPCKGANEMTQLFRGSIFQILHFVCILNRTIQPWHPSIESFPTLLKLLISFLPSMEKQPWMLMKWTEASTKYMPDGWKLDAHSILTQFSILNEFLRIGNHRTNLII